MLTILVVMPLTSPLLSRSQSVSTAESPTSVRIYRLLRVIMEISVATVVRMVAVDQRIRNCLKPSWWKRVAEHQTVPGHSVATLSYAKKRPRNLAIPVGVALLLVAVIGSHLLLGRREKNASTAIAPSIAVLPFTDLSAANRPKTRLLSAVLGNRSVTDQPRTAVAIPQRTPQP